MGKSIDETQAEYIRVPHATLSLHPLPVALSDAFPPDWNAVSLAQAFKPGGSVVIVGAGLVGMAALLTARLYKPSLIVMVDLNKTRLGMARKFGARVTVNSPKPDGFDARRGV